MEKAPSETHRLNWRGRRITIKYHPASFAGCAQLEIRSWQKRPLPITETGYRAHYAAREDVEHLGGPAAFVTAWLDSAAQTKAWQRIERGGLQLTLF